MARFGVTVLTAPGGAGGPGNVTVSGDGAPIGSGVQGAVSTITGTGFVYGSGGGGATTSWSSIWGGDNAGMGGSRASSAGTPGNPNFGGGGGGSLNRRAGAGGGSGVVVFAFDTPDDSAGTHGFGARVRLGDRGRVMLAAAAQPLPTTIGRARHAWAADAGGGGDQRRQQARGFICQLVVNAFTRSVEALPNLCSWGSIPMRQVGELFAATALTGAVAAGIHYQRYPLSGPLQRSMLFWAATLLGSVATVGMKFSGASSSACSWAVFGVATCLSQYHGRGVHAPGSLVPNDPEAPPPPGEVPLPGGNLLADPKVAFALTEEGSKLLARRAAKSVAGAWGTSIAAGVAVTDSVYLVVDSWRRWTTDQLYQVNWGAAVPGRPTDTTGLSIKDGKLQGSYIVKMAVSDRNTPPLKCDTVDGLEMSQTGFFVTGVSVRLSSQGQVIPGLENFPWPNNVDPSGWQPFVQLSEAKIEPISLNDLLESPALLDALRPGANQTTGTYSIVITPLIGCKAANAGPNLWSGPQGKAIDRAAFSLQVNRVGDKLHYVGVEERGPGR